MPNATDRTPGTDSDSTRSPPGRTVRQMTPPSGSVVRVRVLPGRWLRPARSIGTEDRGLGVRGLLGRHRLVAVAGPGLLDHGDQAELAARVDLGDLDLHLVADLDHVVDVLDPLAAGELAQLRDVQQAVLAGRQRDERAERRGLDDGAEVALADLGQLWRDDGAHGAQRGLRLLAVDCGDVDRAVVLDGQVGAGVVLDLVDDLALG